MEEGKVGRENDVIRYIRKVSPINVRQHSVMCVIVRTIGQEYLSNYVVTMYMVNIQTVLKSLPRFTELKLLDQKYVFFSNDFKL